MWVKDKLLPFQHGILLDPGSHARLGHKQVTVSALPPENSTSIIVEPCLIMIIRLETIENKRVVIYSSSRLHD